VLKWFLFGGRMKKREFKTQSKQLLDLMINSIYTQKEIFLRELVSNASDATDKRHYLGLTDPKVGTLDEYPILIELDEVNRTITLDDNGIGLTEKELEENLGTIAQSGSKAFMEGLEKKDVNVIGQFGVGFYSAFMVAKKVDVYTQSPYSDKAYLWSSEGESSYTISETEKEGVGTRIVLHLRDEDEVLETNYNDFLKAYTIKSLVKKYSDYIKYPIQMWEEKPAKEGKTPEKELITLNQMTPLWKKPKSDIKKKERNAFYQQQFNDYDDPFHFLDIRVEGALTYTSLLFIPKKPPYDFYTENYERGLQLYSKGVFIQDKNKELIPKYFGFVRGLVDSSDLSLNISREILQHNRQLSKIASNIEKKIKSELEKLLKNQRDRYVEFYEQYKNTLKLGIYEDYGMHKDLLSDLIMYKTSKSETYITLAEYIERLKEGQEHIYFATGKSKAAIEALPQMELMKEKDYEVLYCTDEIDSFMIQMMMTYQEKTFKSIQQGESDLIDDSTKEDIKSLEKTHDKLLKKLKKALKDNVKDVKLTAKLKEAPVCISSGEGLSLEMERILASMPGQVQSMKADKILELNPYHPLFEKLQDLKEETLESYAKILYFQALLIEGQNIDEPKPFLDAINQLIS
jgi:molecular chaperone HtpG